MGWAWGLGWVLVGGGRGEVCLLYVLPLLFAFTPSIVVYLYDRICNAHIYRPCALWVLSTNIKIYIKQEPKS